MPIIEEYTEPNNEEENEEETTDYKIVSVTMEDKIALGKASDLQKKLYGDRSDSQVVESTVAKRDEIVKTFRQFNNNTSRNSIISNIAILNYFEPLRADADKKGIYNSILKIYSGARQAEEAVQKQRVLHQKAISEISKIYGSGEVTRQFFEKTFTNLTSLEESLKKLHAIDEKQLNNCLELKKEMDKNQSNFPSLTTLLTQEDFINLGKLFIAEVNIMLLETKPEERKTLQDEIEIAKNKMFEAIRQKFLLEKKVKLNELKIENTDEVLKRLTEKKESIEAEIKLLEKGKSENNEKKLDILKVCNDPNTINKKKEEHKNACKALRESFEKKLVEKVEEIDGEQKTLLNDIRNVKTVMRHLNLIFLIDESGSMEESDNIGGKNHYETVIECVKACVEKRKARQVTNDKYSVVKFDHRAEISIINRSVKEGFGEISAMRKGGTSFVEPLKKLAQILNENNFDAFIPVILFLSDGKGESKSKVLKQCQNVIKDFDNEDMLFLSVAFGKDADVDTLQEMSQAFNKGKSFISIGPNQILVFYRAENQKQLLDAFTVYEKFFDYQENLLETKRNMLTSHLAKQEKVFEQNLKIIEAIDKKNEEALEACRLQDEKLADNLDKLNERLEARIETCRQSIGEISKQENIIKNEKKEHETEKSHLEETKTSLEDAVKKHTDEFNEKSKTYQEFNKVLNEKRENAIKALKDDKNFNMLLENIAKLGVEIKEEHKDQFRIDYKSFIQDYNLFLQQLQELQKNSNAITLLIDGVLAICELIRNQQTTAIDLATGEELSNKMWPLFCEYFFNDQTSNEANDEKTPKKDKVKSSSKTKDAEMLKILIIAKMPKRDANDPKIDEAFNMIFDYESVREIFANIEQSRRKKEKYVDGFVEKMKKHIEKDVEDLNEQLTVAKEENADENSEEKNSEIDELKKALADKKNQKLNIIKYGAHMRKILGLLDQMINEVREEYLDASLKKSFKRSFMIFQNTLNPQIHVLLDGFHSSDHDTFTSSASNSIESNLGKLSIKN